MIIRIPKETIADVEVSTVVESFQSGTVRERAELFTAMVEHVMKRMDYGERNEFYKHLDCTALLEMQAEMEYGPK